MFRFWDSSICLFSNPVCLYRDSTTIHQHIFTCLAGAQFTDCITYLPNTHFVLVCTDYHIFANSLIICFCSLDMPAHVLFPCFTHLLSFHPSKLPYKSSMATLDRHPEKSTPLSWPALGKLSSHLFIGTHSCVFHSSPQNPHYPVQAPCTSHLNWSDKTPSYPNRGIKF